MAQCIEICVEDDGSFSLETKEKEETPEQESAEGGEKQTFKSADEVLAAVSQMLTAGSMAPVDQGGLDAENPAEASVPEEEQDAMAQSFQPRR